MSLHSNTFTETTRQFSQKAGKIFLNLTAPMATMTSLLVVSSSCPSATLIHEF